MQWLIDIIYEKVMAAIGPHNPFVDAGDIADYHWRKPLLSTNGAWHTLDLSGIIPVGTKAVLMRMQMVDNLVGAWWIFRTNGNVRSYNAATMRTQVANIWIDFDFIVAPDANRKIEYIAQNTIFTDYYLAVKGWWL